MGKETLPARSAAAALTVAADTHACGLSCCHVSLLIKHGAPGPEGKDPLVQLPEKNLPSPSPVVGCQPGDEKSQRHRGIPDQQATLGEAIQHAGRHSHRRAQDRDRFHLRGSYRRRGRFSFILGRTRPPMFGGQVRLLNRLNEWLLGAWAHPDGVVARFVFAERKTEVGC